jgi:hypothetical protein
VRYSRQYSKATRTRSDNPNFGFTPGFGLIRQLGFKASTIFSNVLRCTPKRRLKSSGDNVAIGLLSIGTMYLRMSPDIFILLATLIFEKSLSTHSLPNLQEVF